MQIRCQNECISISLCTNGFKVFGGVFTDNPINLLFNSLLSCPLFLKFSCADHKNIASHPQGMGKQRWSFGLLLRFLVTFLSDSLSLNHVTGAKRRST